MSSGALQLGTVVDGKALWQTVVYSAAAGIGVTIVFAIALLGAARSVDLSRDHRNIAAAAWGSVALIALAAVLGAVALGIVVMASK